MSEAAKPLFEWTIDALRNAFVLARFEQPNVFGSMNIEAWLDNQRKLETPTIHEWTLMLSKLQNNSRLAPRELKKLRSLMSPFKKFPEDPCNPFKLSGRGDMIYIRHFMQSLHANSSFQFYYGTQSLLTSDAAGNLWPIIWTGCEMSFIVKVDNSIRYWVVLIDVIFAEWLYKRKHWRAARTAICNMCGKLVADARRNAERDFNCAVAVSADGKKIVLVDEIIVFTATGKRLAFEAAAFRNNKLIRANDMCRIQREDDGVADYHAFDGKEKEYLQSLDRHILYHLRIGTLANEQYFVEYRLNTHHRTRLLTPEKFCPSPLPEGGREF